MLVVVVVHAGDEHWREPAVPDAAGHRRRVVRVHAARRNAAQRNRLRLREHEDSRHGDNCCRVQTIA